MLRLNIIHKNGMMKDSDSVAAEEVIIGGKYNFWTVIGKADDSKWICECACGRRRRLSTYRLLSYKNGKEFSNGCGYCESIHYKDHPRIIVNGCRIPVYSAWCNMRERCFNPNHRQYHNYGGRGITVCTEWNNSFIEFYNYVSKLEHYGEDGRSIDRINNNEGYFPGNVRWATVKEQANNKRQRRRAND